MYSRLAVAAIRLFTIACVVPPLQGCGVLKHKAVGMVASTLASSGDVFTRDDDPELVSTRVHDEPMLPVCSPRHRLVRRRKLEPRALAGESWITFPKSNPARRWLDDNSRKAGFRPVITAEIETFTQMKAFVEVGHGITLLPSEFVSQEIELGILRAVPTIEPTATLSLGYAYDERQARPSVNALRAVLEGQLRALVRSSQRV